MYRRHTADIVPFNHHVQDGQAIQQINVGMYRTFCRVRHIDRTTQEVTYCYSTDGRTTDKRRRFTGVVAVINGPPAVDVRSLSLFVVAAFQIFSDRECSI
jgi:hypothetical protein